MKARIAQLVSRFIAMTMLGVTGYIVTDIDPDTQQTIVDISNGIATGVVAFVFLVVDLAIHKMSAGSIMANSK